MKNLELFDKNGKALNIDDVISHFTKFKKYGTKTDGTIFYIDEDKLNQDHINQIRNYLNSREKSLKVHK
jgi:cation transport regulator ChaC